LNFGERAFMQASQESRSGGGATFARASVLLLGYNQEHEIEQAMRACLAQKCEPLEVVFSDDASTDSTFNVMLAVAESYRGPHSVVVRRNEVNLGIAGHYNRLVDVAHGELLITAAGDDISEPDRVARLLEAWDSTASRADLICSHVTDIDISGHAHGVLRVDDLAQWRGVDDWVRRRPHIIGASHAFTRRLMRRFGPIDPALHYEDQIIAFRAIASGGAVTVDAALVRYRRGGLSGNAGFESAEQRRSWNIERLRREIVEREQLVRDAEVVGCANVVAAALEPLRLRQDYLRQLYEAGTASDRWRALVQSDASPSIWRIRKWLQVMFPGIRV